MAGRGACDKFGHVEMTSARHVVSNERRRCAVYFDLIRPSVRLSVCPIMESSIYGDIRQTRVRVRVNGARVRVRVSVRVVFAG